MQAKHARTLTEEARRAQIVAAAIEVIAEHGAQASFKAIATRAGLSSTGLISYHFADRQELVQEIGVEILARFREFVLAHTDGVEEPAAVLRGFVEANVGFLQTHRAHATALVRIRQDLALQSLALSDQVQLAELLRQGQRDGVFGEFDPRLVAVFILAVRDGIIRQLDLDPDLDLAAAGREFATLVDRTTRKG